MNSYKAAVNAMGLNESDRKKLLALPFYMNKRKENPEPKKGQKEYQMFKDMYGKDWLDDAGLKRDPETKITEFDYENHFSPELLAKVDTQAPAFKNFVRQLNFTQMTKYEQHQDDKKAFKELMPLFAGLSDDEKDALLHKLQNDQRSSIKEKIFAAETSNELEKKLALVSEEENHNVKNWYRHQRQTLDWADKKRMPVDERKVRDMLRNQHIFRRAILDEVPNYEEAEKHSQQEHGLL
jgi:hypothetical protein